MKKSNGGGDYNYNYVGAEKTTKAQGYLYLSEKKILKLPSFQEISCDQRWPDKKLEGASAALVSYRGTKEIMLCGGRGITGCRIWTSHGWWISDTTFNRRGTSASEIDNNLL